jgi:hypothetical protein
VRCTTTGRFPVAFDGVETGLLCPIEKIDVLPGDHDISILDPADGRRHLQKITTRAHATTRVAFSL